MLLVGPNRKFRLAGYRLAGYRPAGYGFAGYRFAISDRLSNSCKLVELRSLSISRCWVSSHSSLHPSQGTLTSQIVVPGCFCQRLSVFCQSLPLCSLEGVCWPNKSSKQTGTRIGLRVHPQLVEKKFPCCSYMLPGDGLSSEIVGFVGRIAQGKHPLREWGHFTFLEGWSVRLQAVP